MKKIVFSVLALFATISVYAQADPNDPRYGETPEDRSEYLRNYSIYTEDLKTNNYAEAYVTWKKVFEKAPLASLNNYTNGVKILRALYKEEKDATLKAQYSEELMKVYEQRLQYLDQLNAQSKSKVSEGDVKGQYAHDFLVYNPKPTIAKAYPMLREAVDLTQGTTQYYVLDDLMNISSQRYLSKKDNQEYRDALLQDYIDCSTYIDMYIEAQTNEQVKTQALKAKENIDGHFVKSGAADCDALQGIYGPKIEENKENLEYLNKVVTLMSMFDCKSSDAYLAATEYSFKLAPSVKTAKILGSLYLKQRDDLDKVMEYYELAVELDDDKNSIADTYYTEATIFLSMENYDKSRACLQKCLANNPNKGDAYILMAQLYNIKRKWNNDSTLDRCAYYAILDKLEQAKRVDPSVADKANSLIKQFSEQITSLAEDLFMYGYKKGDKIEIKGWINETTTIR